MSTLSIAFTYQMSEFLQCDAVIVNEGQGRLTPTDSGLYIPVSTPLLQIYPSCLISTPYLQHTHLAQLSHSLLTLIILLMCHLMDTYIIKKFRWLSQASFPMAASVPVLIYSAGRGKGYCAV